MFDQNLINIMTSQFGMKYLANKIPIKDKTDLIAVIETFPCELRSIAEHISNYIQFISINHAMQTTEIAISLAYHTLKKIRNEVYYIDTLKAIQFAPDSYKSDPCNLLACNALKMYLV